MTRERSPKVAQAMRGLYGFVLKMFIGFFILGASSATGYYYLSTSEEKTFHALIIFAFIAVTFPLFSTSIRIMIKMYELTVEGMEMQNYLIERIRATEEKTGPIVDKIAIVTERAIPIAENIEEIVKRAKGMAEDVERIAHRVRKVTDDLNGSLSVKVLEKKLDTLGDSLATIAGAFEPYKPKKKADGPLAEGLPALSLDPMKAGDRGVL